MDLVLARSARNTLSPRFVETVSKRGLYADGGSLYLQVRTGASGLLKSWIFRYRQNGKLKNLGLGHIPTVSLSMARKLAGDRRTEVALARNGDGPFPLELRAKLKAQERATFSVCANEFIDTHKQEWKSPKSEQQWRNTLSTYVEPHIGDLSASEITSEHIQHLLEPIWLTKPETARRVRQRVKRVLDYAKSAGYRSGDNPAELAGALKDLLPNQGKVTRKTNFAAMPYQEVPAFFAELAKRESPSALALRWTILTAARTSETRLMQAKEIQGDLWVVPVERMKAGRKHTVPLSPAALELVKFNVEGWVWPGKKGPLSDMAMLELLRGMRPGLTVHGFRSSFRDWCAEATDVQNHVAEMCLAHAIENAVEAAYRRGELLAKRRDLLEQWAAFVTGD